MAIRTQFSSDSPVNRVQNEGSEALQAILATQGTTVTYEEATEIGHELLGFFEALGEENEQSEGNHA